jgi:hypothetical protein
MDTISPGFNLVQVRLEDHARDIHRREEVGQQDRWSAWSQTPHRAGAEQEQDGRRNDGGDVRIDDGDPGMGKALIHGRRGALPARTSSRMRSKISTFESTPIPMVRMTPAMPGKVSVRPSRSPGPPAE